MTKAVFEVIEKNGEATKQQIMELTGMSKSAVNSALNSLLMNERIEVRKEGVKNIYSVKSSEEEETEEDEEGLENEMQEVIESISKFITKDVTKKAFDDLMPALRRKIIEEFGMVPIKHEIKIGNNEPTVINAELPPCFDSILAYSTNGNAVMMTGPAGTGKGYLARQVALATGAKFFEVNAVKNSYDLTGFVDANSKFVTTPFYDACKTVAEGGKAVFLFDEMDCSEPEVLKIFNEALASFEFTFPNNEHLTFDNLIILCACNTFGTGADETYCGQQLDASTLDRFVMVRVDYDRDTELSLAKGDTELVDFVEAFRTQTQQNGLVFVASYRSIKRIVSMKGVLPLKQVMKECFLKSIAEDDLQNVLNNIYGMGDNIYFRACSGEDVQWTSKKAA